MNSNKITIWVAAAGGIALILALLVWFFFFRSTATVTTDTSTPSSSFGDANNTVVGGNNSNTTQTNGTQKINTTPTAQQKIFKISAGPIVGGTLIQTLRPTTTIARYIRQDDGHVFDIPLGVSGAVPRVVSNITIPGGQRVIWLEGGSAAIMEYVDDSNIVKTVYLGFPAATTSTAAALPTRLQFLPDNIVDIAASPDGKSVVYLLKTASGADGYTAKSSGINSKKLFSLQLSQLLVTWPSPGTILVQTNSAAGAAGMVFAVNSITGSVTELLSAEGLTAIGNAAFTSIVYETSQTEGLPTSYLYNIKNNKSFILTPTMLPEKCTWGTSTAGTLYCATALSYATANFLDLWHAGLAGNNDMIYSINPNTGISTLLAIPGSGDGGVGSDIYEMMLSPDEHYLSFATKGTRALWGVTLVK